MKAHFLKYGHESGLRLLLPQFPRKVVEHAQLIAVQIGDPELAQVPRFILRLSKDLRPSLPPTMV